MYLLNKKNFVIAAVISACIAGLLLLLSYTIGKVEFFLLLNTNLGTVADYFFGIITDAGDSLLWIVVLLIVRYGLKRKDLWPALVSSFTITTILTQVCKYFIFPDEPRPWVAITDHSIIHHVWFVEPWLFSSFPSGHTATAFSFYLLFCLLLQKNWWLYAGFVYAVIVAYSRIYLAQHFPLDLGAGMLVAIVSVTTALFFQRWWWQKNGNN